MATAATTDNQAVAGVDTVLRQLVDFGVNSLETALNASMPWTAVPVLRQLIDAGIGWIGDRIYQALADDGTYVVLKFQTVAEKWGYAQAVSDLKSAQASNDPLILKAAQLAFAAAASNLIHSDGSHTA